MKISPNIESLKSINAYLRFKDFCKQLPYNFDDFIYQGSQVKGVVICKEHGNFYIRPNDILSGHLCPKCGIQKRTNKRKLGFYKFLEKAKSIHGKYEYPKFIYKNNKQKIEILCPEHGIFTQRIDDHLNKTYGCPKCGYITRSNMQKGLIPIIFYIIKYKGLYKVGVTKNGVLSRYKSEVSNLNDIEIIFQKEFEEGFKALEIEEYFKTKYKGYLYTGNKIFKNTRNTEIFTINIFEAEQAYLKKGNK